MIKRITVMAVSVALSLSAVRAHAGGKPSITPVQAKLTGDLAARLLQPGSIVHAQVAVEWTGSACLLRKGAILEGHVVSVVTHSRSVQDSELSIAFTRAQCGRQDLSALDLSLVGVAAPPEHQDLGILDSPIPLMIGSGAGAIATLKMAQTSVNMPLMANGLDMPQLTSFKIGDVVGISRLKLSNLIGPQTASVLRMKGRDVSLEKDTLLLFVPTQSMIPVHPPAGQLNPASTPTPGSAAAAPPPPVPELPPPPDDDVDLCTATQCNTALPSAKAVDVGNPASGISIRELGYTPRPKGVMASLDHDEALAYLGPDELLVAFKPHILAPRHELGNSGPTRRIIRVALVDTHTSKVTRTVDWELPDFQDFLWPLGEGRVLAHVGSELRVYSRGLKIENRKTLDGPLAFVRLSPNGNFIAVGVVHERHTPELHEQLHDESDAEPEEDVSVVVLNRKFEAVAESRTSSRLMPPTLLDEGQAILLAQPDHHYRIAMLSWDSHASTIARFTSSCTPQISTIGPDLIFLVSCDKRADFRDYRVLRPDGKPILMGRSTLNEIGHTVESSGNLQFFAIKIVEASSAVRPDANFSADDLVGEKLAVYRAVDGKRVLGVRVGLPSLSGRGYALSPDGSELAVLNSEQISVYSVPTQAKAVAPQ